MKINKITTGFVVQTFDTDSGKFTEQNFTAGDETTWNDHFGNQLERNSELIVSHGWLDEPYLDFEMVQPNETVQPKN